MKTLYSILELAVDASQEQIEKAYRVALEDVQQGRFPGDAQIRLVALREAYATLSDPLRRQMYDQKLRQPQSAEPVIVIEEKPSVWNLKTLLVLGGIVLAGIALYTHQMREKERLRLEVEKELVAKALKLAEEKQRQEAEESLRREERMQEASLKSQEMQQQYVHERALREADYRFRQNLREEESRARDEAAAREQQERQRQNEARRQLERDKQTLRRMEYENYGRSYSR